MDVPDDLSPGEQRLLEALRAGEPCDLLGDSRAPTSDEIAKWHEPARIELRGAVLDGNLKLTGQRLGTRSLSSCEKHPSATLA